LLLPQVVSILDANDGRLSVTYASTAPSAAAAAADGSGAAAATPEQQQQQQLVVDALVLATGGFGASKEMLRVCASFIFEKLRTLIVVFMAEKVLIAAAVDTIA
jgi:hypothetical protein